MCKIRTGTIETERELEELHKQLRAAGYVFHHESSALGYQSRKSMCTVDHYRGHFGTGYVIDSPNYSSTRYHWRAYYVKLEA